MAEKPTVFMTRAKLEVMLKKGKEKAFMSFIDVKPPYSVDVAVKPYPSKYKGPKFQKFKDRRATLGNKLSVSLFPWVLMPRTMISI